jgi:hypothetical protein
MNGRDDWIRTSDLTHPILVFAQSEQLSDAYHALESEKKPRKLLLDHRWTHAGVPAASKAFSAQFDWDSNFITDGRIGGL